MMMSTASEASSSSSSSLLVTERNFRLCLTTSLANVLMEVGFTSTEGSCLEVLTELCQAFIMDLGARSRSFSEIAGRSMPLAADVILGLANMGATPCLSSSLQSYAFRGQRRSTANPVFAAPPKPPSILHTGERSKHKYDAALPEYPDSHSYTRTSTHKRPVMEYVAVREKAATQRRDVERALTHFVAKTSSIGNKKGASSNSAQSLFNAEDANPFPLIATHRSAMTVSALTGEKLVVPAYLNALVFRDQAFEEDEMPVSSNNNNSVQDKASVKKEEDEKNNGSGNDEESEGSKKNFEDNPFLRQPKRARLTNLVTNIKS